MPIFNRDIQITNMQMVGKGKQMTDCKQCKEHGISMWGDVGCFILRDWISRDEYKEGKKILDNCPKKEQK